MNTNTSPDLYAPMKMIYTAQSKHLYYAKTLVCQYVAQCEAVPLNPFNVWAYFLYDLVDRDVVRRGNNNIVRIADETWVFGPISNGVHSEILYALSLNKPLKFFALGSSLKSIVPITLGELVFEPCVSLEMKRELMEALGEGEVRKAAHTS